MAVAADTYKICFDGKTMTCTPSIQTKIYAAIFLILIGIALGYAWRFHQDEKWRDDDQRWHDEFCTYLLSRPAITMDSYYVLEHRCADTIARGKMIRIQ